MAHYMPWYETPFVEGGDWGWHWTMNHFAPQKNDAGSWENFASHYTPLTGLYDSSDEQVLEYQVQLMKLSGIDGVIVDWYGMEEFWDYGQLNRATGKLFEATKKAGLKFVICYEDATIKNMVENKHFTAEEALPHGQKVMQYMQDTWFKDEAYLKVNDRPVLFTFGPQYFKDPGQWNTLFEKLDPQPVFLTLDNPVSPAAGALKANAGAYPWPPMWGSVGGVLRFDTLKEYLASFASKSERWEYRVGGAFPGFYDIYKEAGVGSGYGFLDAQDGKIFRYTMQEAFNQKVDMVQLITWNDYGEGTIIEPTVEFEYRYLEMVQEARQVTDASFAYTADDLRLPFQLYQLRVKYAQDAALTEKLDQASAALSVGDVSAAAEIIKNTP